MFKNSFHNTVSALAYAIAQPRAEEGRPDLQPPYNDVTQFILQQHARMAGFLQTPLMAATLGFDAMGILGAAHRFHKLSPEARLRQVEAWRDSKLGFKRDLARYFESLTVLAWYSREAEAKNPPADPTPVAHRQVITQPNAGIEF